MFPSFFTKQQSEFTPYLTKFSPDKRSEFFEKAE